MNSKCNLIAISGVKCSGKDVTSHMLQYCLSVPKIFRRYWFYKWIGKIIPKKWKIIAFADPLKRMLATLLNVPVEKFNDRSFKEDTCINLNTLEYSLSVFIKDKRFISDSKFTKMTKDLNLDIISYDLSIRQLMQYFGTTICRTYFGENIWINSTLKHAAEKTIISDCRFINEAEAIKNKGGKIIYVSRLGTEFGHHQSEKEMWQMLKRGFYDFQIDNNGTLKDLFYQVKYICNEI